MIKKIFQKKKKMKLQQMTMKIQMKILMIRKISKQWKYYGKQELNILSFKDFDNKNVKSNRGKVHIFARNKSKIVH